MISSFFGSAAALVVGLVPADTLPMQVQSLSLTDVNLAQLVQVQGKHGVYFPACFRGQPKVREHNQFATNLSAAQMATQLVSWKVSSEKWGQINQELTLLFPANCPSGTLPTVIGAFNFNGSAVTITAQFTGIGLSYSLFLLKPENAIDV